MEDNRQIIEEDEIDLIELVKTIWSKRWFIAKVTGVFIALGLVIAFTSPNEYETSCILIPEAMDGGGGLGGSLGGLAALAGVDLGGMSGGGSTINPGLYRSVAQSTPFLNALLNEKFYFRELNEEISLYDYYLKHYKSSLFSRVLYIPFKIINWLKPEPTMIEDGLSFSSDLVSLTKEELGIMESLKERIVVTMDWELSIIIIDVEMRDPVAAAQIAKYTQDYITDFVINYSVSKSNEQLSFVTKQYKERKIQFEEAQLALAKFRDQNRNVNTAQARSKEESLQAKYNLAYSVFNQIAKQLESIRLQVNESTPVFTVLEPIKIPTEKSKPRKAIILVLFTFFGVTCGLIALLLPIGFSYLISKYFDEQ